MKMMPLMLICLLWGGSLSAASGAELSAYVATKVIAAQKQASADNLSEAIQTLRTIKASRSYDKAYIAQVLGAYYWQNDQFEPAIQQVRYAVSSGQFKGNLVWSLKRMLADLLTNQHQYKEALTYYQQLIATIPPEKQASELWLRIAQVNYQLTNWQAVLESVRQYEGFKLPDAVTPLSIKLGAQIQLKRYQSAMVTVKRLLVLEPNKKNWWLQLVSMELKTHDAKAALGTLALAKLTGISLSTADIKLLAQLYGQNGIPERAARILDVLEDTSQNPQDLIQSAYYWQQAKEWGKALEKWLLVAQQHQQYYWNVAQIQIQQGLYRQALTSLDQIPETLSSKTKGSKSLSSKTKDSKTNDSKKKAPKEKNLKAHAPKINNRDGQAARIALARTQVLYKLNQLDSALTHAKKANQLHPSKEAKGWIKYLTQLRRYQQERGT